MQVEDVARICLASGRTMKRKRHLTIGDSLLGEGIVHHEHVATGMLCIGGVAVLVVVHEVLADCRAGHGRNVLHWRGVGRSGRDDDRLVQDALLGKGLPDACHRGCLLADCHVDADDVGVALVDDGVDGDGRLARLTVANDELTLAATNGDHGIDCHETRLDGLADRLALHDARGLELDGATVRGIDCAKAVDGLTKRVDDAAEHGVSHGDIHDATRRAALVSLLDDVDITKENRADLVLVQVLGKAVYGSAAAGARELKQLAGHCGPEARDVGNSVAHGGDDRRLLAVNRGIDLGQLAAQRVHDLCRADLLCHVTYHFRRRSNRGSCGYLQAAP